MATSLVPNNPFETQPPSPSPAPSPSQGQGLIQSAASFNPQMRQVDRNTETAAGQVESLLSKDSPLMQRARTMALQQMNQRGLVNSSMAIGASQAAMMDRITPIAQQDAQTYSNQALANQKAANEGGMFNAAEQNKFGLQRGEQGFEADQNRIGREFQTSERQGSQQFAATQTQVQQQFQAAQAQLDRAQQVALADKSIEAQQALQVAQQNFQASQANLDRFQQQYLQTNQQQFAAQQSALDRSQQLDVLARQQGFDANEAVKDRAQQLLLADKNITAQQALQQAQQEFQRGESALDRAQQKDIQTAQQDFQRAQADLDRAQQVALADKSIEAQKALETARQDFQKAQSELDRTQQLILAERQIDANKTAQSAQQDFQRAQAELDRAQQVALTDKSITAQQNLQTAQQEFQRTQAELDRTQQSTLQTNQQNFQSTQAGLDRAQQLSMQTAQQEFQKTQAQLDRSQQEAMVRLQNTLSQANVSGTFAANIVGNTSAAINAAMADPNLTPEAKRGAIDNIIASSNATLQWGASFYNTPLPGMASPGSSSGVIAPAPGTPRPAPTAPEIVAAYQDLLGRAPDEQGLRYYMNSGLSVEQIRQEIARSDEAVRRATTTPAPAPVGVVSGAMQPPPAPAPAPSDGIINRSAVTSQAVTNAYRQYLGRDPTAQEAAYWVGTSSTTNSDSQIVANIAAASRQAAPAPAPEPAPALAPAPAPAPAPTSQVADLYRQVLGREPDAGGLAYWTQQFGSNVDPSELATFTSVAQAELAGRR